MNDERSVIPLAYQRKDAAAALAMSVDHFDRHVRQDIARVYAGNLTLYPVAELERWLAGTAAPPLGSRFNAKRPRAAGTAGGMAQGDATP